MKKKTKMVAASIILVAAVVITGVGAAVYKSKSATDTETVSKETSVEKGNIVVGVTENGSVSVGTLEQSFDLDTSSSSSSTSSSSASSSTGASSSGRSTTGSSTTGNSSNTSTGVSGSSSTGTDQPGSSTASGSTTTSGSASSTSSTSKTSSTSTSNSSTSTTTATLEVEEVYVKTGQKVNAGDPILKLTDDSVAEYKKDLEEAVTTATLAVKEAKMNVQTSKLEADYTYDTNVANGTVAESEYNSTITTLQAAVDNAQDAVNASNAKIADYQSKIAAGANLSSQLTEEQSNLATLQAKLASAQNAYTTKSIAAKETYDEAMLNYNNASSIHSIDTNGINDNVENAQDTLDDAQDALSEFEKVVGDGKIYAEYSGRIMSLGYAAGDTLSSSTSIATYADDTAVTIAVSVSQEDISAVKIGDTVNIALTAYDGEAFTGTVSSMDTTTSSKSSTISYTVTIAFTGDVSKVYAGMTGDVTFVTKEVDNVIYVSDKAIQTEGTKSYVDVKNSDGTTEKREVQTGFSNGVNVEITDGLKEGETALIESQVSK
jgi:HlyD family secretion protein